MLCEVSGAGSNQILSLPQAFIVKLIKPNTPSSHEVTK